MVKYAKRASVQIFNVNSYGYETTYVCTTVGYVLNLLLNFHGSS